MPTNLWEYDWKVYRTRITKIALVQKGAPSHKHGLCDVASVREGVRVERAANRIELVLSSRSRQPNWRYWRCVSLMVESRWSTVCCKQGWCVRFSVVWCVVSWCVVVCVNCCMTVVGRVLLHVLCWVHQTLTCEFCTRTSRSVLDPSWFGPTQLPVKRVVSPRKKPNRAVNAM